MTADYRPGTVARVTYEGETRRAFRGVAPHWYFGIGAAAESDLSDIRPQVVLDLTHDDADRIDQGLAKTYVQDSFLRDSLFRIRDAIREQLPAPKRWTVDVVPDAHGTIAKLRKGGEDVATFGSGMLAVHVADLLNAAEQTGDET